MGVGGCKLVIFYRHGKKKLALIYKLSLSLSLTLKKDCP